MTEEEITIGDKINAVLFVISWLISFGILLYLVGE